MPANGAGAVKATAGRWRSYSVLITEELSTRAVPEPLVDVLSVEQYQARHGDSANYGSSATRAGLTRCAHADLIAATVRTNQAGGAACVSTC